jgi:hypothetical protein
MVILIGLDLAKIGSPFVKMIDAAVFQHTCLQIPHHGIKLAH